MPEIKIGLLGLGTVGSGVYQLLAQNALEIEQRIGAKIKIDRIMVNDPKKDRKIELRQSLLTTDPDCILDNPEIDIVVEVMGGVQPALEYISRALKSGKSVVTANKDIIAMYGKELFSSAKDHRCDLFFEASVAGGIPIIRPLKQCLAANRIIEIMGIINGTTNYILSKMTTDGSTFESALQEAQKLGYAEADPVADVGGFDAARKLAIMASIAFNTRITLNEVYIEGIERINAEDITYAKELNYIIKLVGIARETPAGIEVRVYPAMLSQNHPLAAVNGVFNAIFVRGDAVGETMFYGQGAGKFPTASAVVADIMDAARNKLHNATGIISCTCFEEKRIKPIGQSYNKFYVRLLAQDKPGVLAAVAQAFGEKEVSLAAVIQKHSTGKMAEIVMVTHKVQEQNLSEALDIIRTFSVVEEVSNVIRVEGEEKVGFGG